MSAASPKAEAEASELYLGQRTEPDKIDAGLRDLWSANETATRASLMNLAIYSESPGALQKNTQCVHQLTLEHACRVILIEALASSPESHTEAWITAHCSLGPEGQKEVCCEQLAFRMHGHSPGRLTNLLFANLESDLPLVLWWQASLIAHFDQRISSRVDRLLIDSQLWNDPVPEFEQLRTSYENRSHYFAIHDLNWTRTFHLRLAIAAAFEDPRSLANLRSLQTIEIVHGSDYGTTAQLLGAWLLERLDNNHSGSSSQVPLPDLRFRVSPASIGPIASLSFVSTGKLMTLEHTDGGSYYTWTAYPGAVPQQFPADVNDLSTLLTDQLGRGGNNASYLQIVRRAMQLR